MGEGPSWLLACIVAVALLSLTACAASVAPFRSQSHAARVTKPGSPAATAASPDATPVPLVMSTTLLLVSRGAHAHVDVHGNVNAPCDATIAYSGGAAERLKASSTDAAGNLTLQFMVRADAPAGKARITVECGPSGSASTDFTVQ
ncbi:MAG: hypothetical protein ACYDGR_15665 [Candidatus Dormibacteria bacterium]